MVGENGEEGEGGGKESMLIIKNDYHDDNVQKSGRTPTPPD